MGDGRHEAQAASTQLSPLMPTEECPSFGRLMRIAEGRPVDDDERRHLGHRCPYCEMTVRQSFSFTCPSPEVWDHPCSRDGALQAALDAHLDEGCSSCAERRRDHLGSVRRHRQGVAAKRPEPWSGGSMSRGDWSPAAGYDPEEPPAVVAAIGAGPAASPLRREPVQARARQRIERVLAAAEAVFVEVGYEAATTNMIAARAGTSIGSIYEFFPNKQALAETLRQRYLDELAALYDDAVVDDPGGRDAIVSNVVDALDDFFARHPGFGPLLRTCWNTKQLQLAGDGLQTRLVEQVEQVIATRRQALAPERRRVVARTCANVLRAVMDEVTISSEEEHAAMVAELKLILSSYLAVAVPRR